MSATSMTPFVGNTNRGISHAVDPVRYHRGEHGFAVAYCGRLVSVDHRGNAPVEVADLYDVSCLSCKRRMVRDGMADA